MIIVNQLKEDDFQNNNYVEYEGQGDKNKNVSGKRIL